jgi:hypothetical protein
MHPARCGNSASERRREYFRGNRFAGHGDYMFYLGAKLEVNGVCCCVFKGMFTVLWLLSWRHGQINLRNLGVRICFLLAE